MKVNTDEWPSAIDGWLWTWGAEPAGEGVWQMTYWFFPAVSVELCIGIYEHDWSAA